MEIILDNLDDVTKGKYKEFSDKVKTLIKIYEKTDKRRFDLIKEKIEETYGNWDRGITLIHNGEKEEIDISYLLAYEYCLAGERVTNGKVSFENMMEKLFFGVQKFRIGNPIKGQDDECLYGKSLDDESAIPVTSKLYRMVMNAGAQHLEYVQAGKVTGAVFLYKKGEIENIAQDENGNPVNLRTDGIDFLNLSKGQSLLTNLRQTAFHEWTHNAEKDEIDTQNQVLPYEYKSVDGKVYRNFERYKNYVYADLENGYEEPTYIISTEKDERGNRKRFHLNKEGKKRPLHEVRFGLKKGTLDKEYMVSQGMTTLEVLPSGECLIHNIVTEGFVEKIARDMVRAVDPAVCDIDEGKYPEYVEIATQIISARDLSLGNDGEGQTVADFLSSSSVLKHDLESRVIVLPNGKKVDGLHYVSDYADKVQRGDTRKIRFLKSMPDFAKRLGISGQQMEEVRDSSIWLKRRLSKEDKDSLIEMLRVKEKNKDDEIVMVVDEYAGILEEDSLFFDSIGEALGYTKKEVKKTKTITELAKESIKSIGNLSIIPDIESVEKIEMLEDEERNDSQKE